MTEYNRSEFRANIRDDLETAACAEHRCSECPEEIDCLYALIKYVYANISDDAIKDDIRWVWSRLNNNRLDNLIDWPDD